ncbi:MAG: MBL fold metallo-hydrolase [Candidatus Nitrosocaldus sp.]|nr:MBL fold metallo-hydrolase [Candidatus Nitrosocaldus sp.]MDW8000891.1 MBL fold metallo-hydrolase [Candidatus Nitrosocaldus sp.]
MRVTALGSAREVGRSAFLVATDKVKVLLDYGILLGHRNEPPLFPMHVKPKDIDGVVLTHAHLDHSGCIPSLFLSREIPVHATQPTMELAKVLLLDMIKISGFYLPFEYMEVMGMMDSARTHYYREEFDVGDLRITLHNAGHIVGSAFIVVEHDGRRMLYTGDINARGSRILESADLDVGSIDLLITESTYAMEDHQPREEAERLLVEFANEVVERGGVLFVPAFSVERAQEIACVLRAYNFKYKVAMDGMAIKANEIMLRHPRFLRDAEFFSDVMKWLRWIRGWGERKRMIREPCVVISPAGMLVGGNALFYMENLADDKRNGIAMVSYQGEGTPGRKLLEQGVAVIDGKPRRVSAEVRRFDFSGHSGRRELFSMIRGIKGSPRVWTVHGDDDTCTRFAEEIRGMGLQAYAPLAGESVDV